MQERKPRLLNLAGLWEYALRILAARAYSSGEIREKLRRRAERAGDVDGVITLLKDRGYLDDRRFAESYASARLTNDRFGRSRVAKDLRARRVAPGLAESTVRKVYQDIDEPTLIEDFIRRKYRLAEREGLFEDDKDLARAYRRLLRAGFPSGEILKALKRFARNPELLDAFEPPQEEAE